MRNACLATVAAVSITVMPHLAAQSAQVWHDSAAHLKQAMSALRDSLLPTDSTMPVVARSGPFQIAASPASRAEAVIALRDFVAAESHWFGTALPAPAGVRITTERHEVFSRGRPTSAVGTVVLSALPDTGTVPTVSAFPREGDVGRALLEQYGGMMFATTPTLSRWLHDLPVIADVDTTGDDRAMYMLVASTGAMPRACVRGDGNSCLMALDIRRPPPNSGSQFVQYLRGDLLYAALRFGGDSAWIRLRAADSLGVEAELAATARMPLDSLIRRWRQGLLSRRAADPPVTVPLFAAAALWTSLLLVTAMGASRWA
jgi:hypothetical protein